MLRVWTKRLGQKHYARDGESETVCGMPMLGNNYASLIPESEQKECEKCSAILESELKEKRRKVKDKYLIYEWFNVRTVGELRKGLSLISNDAKIDIDLRLIVDLEDKTKEIQYKKPERY